MAWSPLLLTLLAHCTGSWAQSVLTQPSSVSGALGQRVTISCTGSSSNIGSKAMTGSLSQPVLTQPPSLSASPGASARLTCALSSGFSVGSYGIGWQQQKPESPPHYLLYYHTDSDKKQGSGVPSRFSGSKDTSANAGVLHISGLQPEDEADYYCAIWDGSASHSSLSQPVLTQPPSLSASPGASARLTCALSSGFAVSRYDMYWHQQKPGSPPRYLLRHYTDSDIHQGSGVPSRFSGAKDISANAGVLHISELQPEDEAHYYCSLSQPVLTQPPSLSASLGASARLTCTLSSGSNVGNYWIYWYQQKSEGPPRYLLSYYTGSRKHQGSGVPSRFSGSKDTSANAGVLRIAGLQPEDEADYYCSVWYSNAAHSDTGR
ncbi:Immunoglobulin omega chain [Tupaia chinensis]|nr:Immunoglobulin omega chain [Tupaia chinensis]